MYDLKTNNKSFIKVCKQLKKNGVKNYLFPLTLYDKTLQGLNPFNEDALSVEQKARIRREIERNIWYYLREIVRIKESGGVTRYKAHLGNIAQTYCFIHNIDIIEVLPRQNGKTIGAACNYTWVYHFKTRNSNIIFSNKQLFDSQRNIKRFNDITEELPSYLKVHLNEKNDTSNLNVIRCDTLNNSIEALSTPRDKASAEKLGRGMTVSMVWYDEFAFLKFNKTVFDAAAFALSAASEAAERNNMPHSRIITTTPNNLDEDEGSYCYQLIENAITFEFEFYNMDISKLRETIEKNSRNGFVFIQYSYIELGHDDKWFEKQKQSVDYDLVKIKREILLEWTMSGSDSIFSEDTLTILEGHVKKPITSFYIKDIYRFNVYEKLYNINIRNYIASVDIAAGLDNDSTVITIIDPLTYMPAVVFRSNKIDTVELVQVLIELVDIYFNELVIVPERNNMGISVIQMLLKTHIANHVYFTVNETALKKQQEYEMIAKRNKEKKVKKSSTGKRVYGIDTSPKSRPIMIDQILNNLVNEYPERCNNDEFFKEIKTLVRDKKGKVQARQGMHDDVVMSYLIGLYMMLYTNNVRQFLKVTYIGENEEDKDNVRAIRKHGTSVKKINKLINNNKSSPDGLFIDYLLGKSSELNQKITADEDNRNNTSSIHQQRVKRNISRVIAFNRR